MHRGKDLRSSIDSSQWIHTMLSCVMQIQKLTPGSNTGLCDAAPNLIHPYKAYLSGSVIKAAQCTTSKEHRETKAGQGEREIWRWRSPNNTLPGLPGCCQGCPRRASAPMSRCGTHWAKSTLPQLLTEGGGCLGDMGHIDGCRGKASSGISVSLSSAKLIPTWLCAIW